MDFNRTQPQHVAPSTHTAPTAAAPSGKKSKSSKGTWLRAGIFTFFTAIGLLLIALIVWLLVGVGNNKESQYVDSNRLQAIFLSTGQVYFGNVTSMNGKYTVLTNIYYLQTSSTDGNSNSSNTSNNNVSLVKLGCELHAPYDQMVINHDQITFWENLQDDGQVAKAVQTFEKENPNGQKCADQSSSSSNTSNSVQNAGNKNE